MLLLIGLVCFAAALGVARRGSGDAARDVRGGGAAAWMGLLALLVLVQLAAGRGALEGYRLTLLGFRFAVPPAAAEDAGAAAAGRAEEGGLTVGGSYESADLWVPGAGDRPAARLVPDSGGGVTALPQEDAAAVVLVEEPGLFGTDWRVLGGRPLAGGDTVAVHAGGTSYRLVAGTVPDTLPLGGGGMPLPWVREHVVREVGGGGRPSAGATLLPGVERGLLARLRPFHPSVFQRTYPVADVLGPLASGSDRVLPALSSFFFYHDGILHLADLDSEVEIRGAGPRESGSARVARPGEARRGEGVTVAPGRRILVAGLPLRDYPEPDLVLPERYGVRPARSFRLEREGAWLDAALASPEIRDLDRDALEELRLAEGRAVDGSPIYRIRLAAARDAMARSAVVFDEAPARFAVPGQAVLSLSEEPTRSGMEVLTPSGLARWETGRPLALGTGSGRLLVRVDGVGASAGFWWAYAALLVLPVLLFLLRPMTGAVFALALAAAGLAAFRAILSLSALAGAPWVTEAQQLGLWLLPWLPWAVVVGGELGRGIGGREDEGGDIRRGTTFHGLYALVLVGLAAVLFPGSPVKAAVLGLLALATAGAWAWVHSGAVDVRAAAARVSAWGRRHDRWLRGWSLGLLLLAGRVLLEMMGFREQLTLGGTRIGVSVLYTPVVLAGLALVLVRAGGRLRDAEGSDRFPPEVAGTFLDVGAFLLLALVGVSAWISDFGIALTLLPGALVLLAVLGVRWAPAGRRGVLTVVTLALPLALFALVQAAPPLLRFAWGGDLQAVDARLGEWNRNELLLLERGDPAALRMIGQTRSEALAVMRETMRSYTRGNLTGKGYLEGRVSGAVAETATREHAVSALLASQFGLPGTVGLVLLLLALLPPALVPVLQREPPGRREAPGTRAAGLLGLALVVLVPASFLLPSPYNALLVGLAVAAALGALLAPGFGGRGLWGGTDAPSVGEAPGGGALPFRRLLAASALVGLALAGLYMVLANYGLVFFTGKNVYLLGLDSLGDALEGTALLVMASVAMGAEAARGAGGRVGGEAPDGGGTAVAPAQAAWWHPSDGGDEA